MRNRGEHRRERRGWFLAGWARVVLTVATALLAATQGMATPRMADAAPGLSRGGESCRATPAPFDGPIRPAHGADAACDACLACWAPLAIEDRPHARLAPVARVTRLCGRSPVRALCGFRRSSANTARAPPAFS
jgi:hypothetical protein